MVNSLSRYHAHFNYINMINYVCKTSCPKGHLSQIRQCILSENLFCLFAIINLAEVMMIRRFLNVLQSKPHN